MKRFNIFFWLFTLGVFSLCCGCSSTKNPDADISERPWNAPQGWEHGLPPGMERR